MVAHCVSRGRAVSAAAIILVVGALVGACTSGSGASASAGPLKIGFFAPESGFAAADGQSAYDAAQLAVKEINARAGSTAGSSQLVNYDDASDAKQAVTIATKLVTQDNVTAVVSGSYSDQTLAAAPIFQRASTADARRLRRQPRHPGDRQATSSSRTSRQRRGPRRRAYALVRSCEPRRSAIIAIKNDFGTRSCGFHAGGHSARRDDRGHRLQPVRREGLHAHPQRDKSKGATGFYMAQYYTEGQQYITDWNTLGCKYPLVGTEGVDSTTQFFQPVGAKARRPGVHDPVQPGQRPTPS